MPTKTITIEEYVEGVKAALQYWLDIHTNAEEWAKQWTMDDAEYYFKECPVLENDYFSFDWKDAVLKQWCKENLNLFVICSNCGCIFEDGFEDEECCDESDFIECEEEDLYNWMDELGADGLQFPEYMLLDALIEQGFPIYREALEPITAGVEEEIAEVLEAIEAAPTNQDRLLAVMWGTRVYHVNGNIMSDYGEQVNYNLDYQMINNIRNNGLESVFSKEEIQEYINND